MTDTMIRIIGIDPGLRHTGWGIIDTQGTLLRYVAAGVVKSNSDETLAARLVSLHDGLARTIANYNPLEAAIEKTFVSRDARATLKLGQARGIAMLVPALAGLLVAEYAPNHIKKTVVGVGHCTKEQIRAMIGVLLPTATLASDDAADALAIAITHAQNRAISAVFAERGRVAI